MSRLVDGPCKQIGTTLLPTMGGNNRRRIFFVSHLTISWSPSSSPPSLDGLLGARGGDGCCTALCGFLLLTHHHLNSTPIPLHLHLHHHRRHHHHHHGLPSYYPTFPKCYALGIKGARELLLLHMALNIFWIDWFDTIENQKGKKCYQGTIQHKCLFDFVGPLAKALCTISVGLLQNLACSDNRAHPFPRGSLAKVAFISCCSNS